MSQRIGTSDRFQLRSMKRATILFTEPGRGQSLYQENAGAVDERLRAAIRAAREAFTRVYHQPNGGTQSEQ